MKECKRIVGTSLTINPDFGLMKAAGIQWLRIAFEYPFEDKVGGALSEKYLENLKQAKDIHGMGFKLMGITPLSGIMGFDPAKGSEGSWMPGIPAWAGNYDEAGFFEAYEEGCAEIARQTAGIVDLWQVSNEMDIPEFRGPMTPEQAVRRTGSSG